MRLDRFVNLQNAVQLAFVSIRICGGHTRRKHRLWALEMRYCCSENTVKDPANQSAKRDAYVSAYGLARCRSPLPWTAGRHVVKRKSRPNRPQRGQAASGNAPRFPKPLSTSDTQTFSGATPSLHERITALLHPSILSPCANPPSTSRCVPESGQPRTCRNPIHTL